MSSREARRPLCRVGGAAAAKRSFVTPTEMAAERTKVGAKWRERGKGQKDGEEDEEEVEVPPPPG